MERWASFDCYGTLVDWEGGTQETLARLWPDEDSARLLARYHEIEPTVQAGSGMPYREVMARTLRAIAREEGLELSLQDEGALGEALPSWRVFPEVPGALDELRSRGWGFAILSNTDPDFLAASIRRIGVEPDLAITAAEAGSYKPAAGHWNAFRERSGADPARHVHVGASLFHDIEPAARLGIPAVWINRLGERSDLPRAAELIDLSGLPEALDRILPAR
jgi:2-haloacid dehalogenase